jgi:hypothetical protein
MGCVEDVGRKAGILELRTRISHVRADGREYRVIRPDRTAPRLVVLDQDYWLNGFADRAAIQQLATLWALAAVSPRSIVHVPMRRNGSPEEGRRLDLVLSHHSLQLRPSRWTALRARFGGGAPHTVRIPDPGTPKLDYSRYWHREYLDWLRFDNAADTLFVTGGHESLFRAAVDLRKLLAETADLEPTEPTQHACAELDSGRPGDHNDPRHGTPGRLHIQYEPTDW